MNLAIVTPPFGGIPVSRVDVLERNREVNKEEVEVFNAPEIKLLASKSLGLLRTRSVLKLIYTEKEPTETYMLVLVERVPELFTNIKYD